jgi:hypothetical protein
MVLLVTVVPLEVDEQSRADFSFAILWPLGVDCEVFMTTVSTQDILNELEFRIRIHFPTYRVTGKIENFNYYCTVDRAACTGSILTSGNATVYRDTLTNWLRAGDSYIVLSARRYNVTEEMYRSSRPDMCVQSSVCSGQFSNTCASITTSNMSTACLASLSGILTIANSALIVSAVALVMISIFIFGTIIYLVISKCHTIKQNPKR